MTTLTVTPVRDAGELRRFLDVPFHVHRDDARWIPPLRSDVRARIRFRRNPFWRRADGALFLARRGGTMVGRVSVQLDSSVGADRTRALWGWFETVDDEAVGDALLETATRWAVAEGAQEIVGPASFSALDETGLLVEGFDQPCAAPAPWNPPRYAALIEALGHRHVASLLALRIDVPASSDRVPGPSWRETARALAASADRLGVAVSDLPTFWAPTLAEVQARVRRLRATFDPALVAIEGEWDAPRAVALAVPDLGHVRQELRGPLGFRGAARVMRRAREGRTAAGVAVLAATDREGIRSVLGRLCRRASVGGYQTLDLVASEGSVVHRELETLGARLLRRFHLYQAPVVAALRPPDEQAA